MERPFVGGKDNAAAFYFDFNAGLLDQAGSRGLVAQTPSPLTALSRPTWCWFARAEIDPRQNVKISGGGAPEAAQG
jgi:hypothetical protein